MIELTLKLKFDKVAVALASYDHQKSKLRVRQLKIGSKSCFAVEFMYQFNFLLLSHEKARKIQRALFILVWTKKGL